MRPTKKPTKKSTVQRLSPTRFALYADSERIRLAEDREAARLDRQAAARLISEAEIQARRNRLLEERAQKFENERAERARSRDAIQDRMFVDTAAIAAMRELIRGNNPERAATGAYDFAEALAAQRKLRIAKTAQA